MQTALLIVDVQNDYFPGGKNELAGPVEAGVNAGHLLNAFRERKMHVVFVQHTATKPGATFFRPGTPGAEINDMVKPEAGETVIQKHFPNSFRDTGLLATLENMNVGRLVICGMMTHMCIDSTVRAAGEHGFECIVVRDACATKDLSIGEDTIQAELVHRAFLAALHVTFATVTSTNQILRTISGENGQ